MHKRRAASLVWRIALVLLLLGGLFLAGCQRASRQADQAPDVEITFTVEPSPPRIGPARLIITLADSSGQPIEDARLQIKGDMAHAGMTPVLAEASNGQDGTYAVAFQWTMGGDWFVTVEAELPDGRSTARRFDLTVAGDADMEMDMGAGEEMPMSDEMPAEATETP